ncbi:DUF2442 domain-containing protein [Rhizobium sp. LjRoot258]|uniref:DUF2442 domain-containing protein n=1 Tax=Rhizobium sp. LjRoot258 TaxID=3342299 RepID=UPI003ECDE18C
MGSRTPSNEDLGYAKERWSAERAVRPISESVRYDADSGKVIIEFMNGSAFMVPVGALQGLEGGSEDDLAEVELLGETGLHWERLDVDHSIAGLMSGIFGNADQIGAGKKQEK